MSTVSAHTCPWARTSSQASPIAPKRMVARRIGGGLIASNSASPRLIRLTPRVWQAAGCLPPALLRSLGGFRKHRAHILGFPRNSGEDTIAAPALQRDWDRAAERT